MFNHFQLEEKDGVLFVTFNMKDKSANVFNADTFAEFDLIVRDAAKKSLKGMIIKSAKSTFIAGADVTEFVKLFDKPSEVEKVIKIGQSTFNCIEDMPFPTVSLLNGSAMGGGFELPLACDYRVMSDAPGVQVGLVEIKLGLIPAWGGLTRMPRLIGADNAIELICGGKTVGAKDALKYKLVDVVVKSDKMEEAALNLIKIGGFEKVRKLKKSPIKLSLIESMMTFRLAEGEVSKVGKNYPAPLKALHIMRDARKLERDEALKFEVGAFIELISGNTAKNLINVFIADQAVKAANKKFIKENGSPKVEKVGVVGAGTMGRGIAGQTVSKGLNVKLFDDSEAALNKCIDEVKAYQLSKVGKGYITAEEAENVVKRIKLVSKVEDLANEDIVIEAVYEDFAVKSKVFEKLKNAKVLGTNTSSLSVTGLSGAVENPERLCGVHFFNPVAKMPLVEIIKGKNTSNLAVATALSYAMAIGKTPIMVSDCNGFLVNRLLFPYLIAFDNLVNSGVNYEIIDKVMETWGWPLGPAALSDLVGIDVLYHAAIIMSKAYSDRMKFNLNGPTATLFNNKTFGQKSGKGWYEYTKKGDSLKKGKASWTSGKELNYDDIVRDLMKPMQAEAEIMIKQEVVPSYNEINIALINGAGFPPFRGGLDKPLK